VSNATPRFFSAAGHGEEEKRVQDAIPQTPVYRRLERVARSCFQRVKPGSNRVTVDLIDGSTIARASGDKAGMVTDDTFTLMALERRVCLEPIGLGGWLLRDSAC
jgi:hypothetical protein